MFLHDDNIATTFVKEGFGPNGERENILVVKMVKSPEDIKRENIKGYQSLSGKLAYLDRLAQDGFLDFNRIEITAEETIH